MDTEHRMSASDDRRRPERRRSAASACCKAELLRARANTAAYATPGRGFASTPKGSCSQPPQPSAAAPS